MTDLKGPVIPRQLLTHPTPVEKKILHLKKAKSHENYESMVKKLDKMEATSGSKNAISQLMKCTYSERRKWMDQPPANTSARILEKFIHFSSYGGLMISEEFQRLYPNSIAFDLSDIVSAVLQHSKNSRQKLYEESGCLQYDTLRALQLIYDVLPTVPVKMSKDRSLTNDETNNKVWLAKKPCAAIVQIIPANTDLQGYKNVLLPTEPPPKSKSKQPTLAPVMIWLSDDHLFGEIYLNIDGHYIHVEADPLIDPFPKAFDIFFKLYFVFNVHYHPQLKNSFNFFEYVYGLNAKPIPSVRALVGSIRQIQVESKN
ncbi:uncharacterized protein LOC113205751 [Frankliniella occidentalis]|uniref:Uncharacterized protein LOC113205751 n=1 Tax=Frankliniella occidentalis TaxID=133901 RepID=A0A6J1S7V8_FRAOC|nr:uncharacterized protein LOC113205751 [Frankliniella occidentalis]